MIKRIFVDINTEVRYSVKTTVCAQCSNNGTHNPSENLLGKMNKADTLTFVMNYEGYCVTNYIISRNEAFQVQYGSAYHFSVIL
jgi:hypothetical protein